MLNTEEGKIVSHALEESTQRGTKELKLEGSENKKKSWKMVIIFKMNRKKDWIYRCCCTR